MHTGYDVIVVGARCAGSPTAMLLARRGYRVLLADRASFPSDTVSTLIIHSPGIAALRRWGLLDDLAATGCPPVQRYIFDFGPLVIDGRPYSWDGTSVAYAPRRTILDKILIDAAGRAGAEVREGFTVEDVLIEDGVVAGVRGHGTSGPSVTERAQVVIGADGYNSRIARAAGAAPYHDKPVLERAYYTYWSGLPVDAFTTYIRGDRGIAAIPTNDELTLVLVGVPIAQANDFKRDLEASYLAAIDREPEFAKKTRAATRVDRIVGEGVPNFFRKPFGPGWALVGDAGYTKDPITAQGITDAFHAAERCAEALDQALTGRRSYDEAMTDYQHQRDTRALPIYEFTTQLATLDPPPPEMQQLFAAIAGHQAAMDAFVSVAAGTLPPTDFFDPANIASILTRSHSR